ncbi:MAG: hypothetical protein V1879_05255, partial [Pseudomonadota bacterium]
MDSSGTQFGLAYLDAGEVGTYLETHAGHALGVVGFGREIGLPAQSCEPLWVDIPVLGGHNNSFEVWTSDAPTARCMRD